MVCKRCVMAVQRIFHEAGMPDAKVKLGEVELKAPIGKEKLKKIENKLNRIGFEVLSDRISRLIGQIKTTTVDYVYGDHTKAKVNYSVYLAEQLNREYNYLSSLFSSVEGSTIEKYLIRLKIERVKELLEYGDKTLSEIAFEMGYSSVAHLSGQFKKVSGITPSRYKTKAEKERKSIDQV